MVDTDMNFSENDYNIEAVIRKYGFPAVVKSDNVCQGDRKQYGEEYYQDSRKLPLDSVTMLERKVTLQFAHVTVADFQDPDKVLKEKGIEFMESHSEFEEDDFLLPITFDGKCKIVHPPGKRKRYVDAAELMKDLPRWIRINDKLISVGSDINEHVKVINVGDILEIVDVKKVETVRYLVCRDKEKKNVLIPEHMPVNITAVDDTNLYTLEEITNGVYLPKYIEFEDVSPYDIVIYDDFWANHLLVMTGGPFKINAVVEQEVILGWCIPVEPGGVTRPLRTVLIPKNKWKEQKVKVRKFSDKTERLQYVKKHFPGHSDSEFTNHKFYLMEPPDNPGIVWLQNRQPLSEQPKSEHRPHDSRVSSYARPPPLPIQKEELPESDVGDEYEEPIPRPEPGPPLPPRQLRLPKRVEKPDHWKEILERIQMKTKSGFGRVHSEIRSLFYHKSGKAPAVHPRPKLNRFMSEGNQAVSNAEDTEDSLGTKLRHSASLDSAVTKAKQKVVRSQSTASGKKAASETADFYLTPTADGSETETDEETLSDDEKQSTSSLASISQRPQLPLPEPPEQTHESGEAEDSDHGVHDYDYPDLKELTKRGYVGIDVAEGDRVSRPGQTEKDFYDYSIDEVVYCFKMVALPGMAEMCEKEKIDGQFFKSLSADEIKTYFELDTLHFIKVRKAIFDGWRPR